MSERIMKLLKVLTWALRDGGLLVLVFIRHPEPGKDDRLELMLELHADDQAGVERILQDLAKTVNEAAGDIGKVRVSFAGSKEA